MMSWRQLQSYFYDNHLKKQLQQLGLRRDRKRVNLDSAQSVALLFDATELAARDFVLQYANQLRGLGKKVKLLGYVEGNPENTEFAFSCFTKKQVSWSLRPKSAEVDEFLNYTPDVLIFLSAEPHPWLEYIAALSKAHLRIGPATEHTYCFDVMIDAGNGTDLRQFVKQMELLLKKTNVSHATAQV